LLSAQKVEQLRQEFLNIQEGKAKDPAYMRIMVAFVLDGPDGIGRRLYAFFVRKLTGKLRPSSEA